MSRTPFATAIGVAGLLAYVVGAVTLADRLAPMHWAVQALYFVVAGVLWVAPASLLMVWAARTRA